MAAERSVMVMLIQVLLVCVCADSAEPARQQLSCRIIDVEVKQDGSFDPPGFTIAVTIEAASECKEISVEVNAFEIRFDQESQILISAVSPNFRDAEGNFLAKVTYRANGQDSRGDGGDKLNSMTPGTTQQEYRHWKKMVVPYSELALQSGNRFIAFGCRLLVDGKIVEIVPTKAWGIQIDNSSRTRLTISKTAQELIPEKLVISKEGVRVWNNDVNKLETLPSMELEVVRNVPAMKIIEEEHKVEIKNSFTPIPESLSRRPSITTSQFLPVPRRTILYATNRKVRGGDGPFVERFTNESEAGVDKMHFGKCVTSIPVASARDPGQLNQPGSWWYFWKESDDPTKHFLIMQSVSLNTTQFIGSLSTEDTLVFVHGYNNSFKDSILRSAQLQHDLRFKGDVVAFSWPSCGSTLVAASDSYDGTVLNVKTAYGADERQAELSSGFLADLLQKLVLEKQRAGGMGRVHVLAHSMGNRVLLNALQYLPKGIVLGQVIMAAADINAVDYSNCRDALRACSAHVTFYFSETDLALRLSRTIHQDRPIGMAALFDSEHMDTISASGLTGMFEKLGHLYALESNPLLTDVGQLLANGQGPEGRRPPLCCRTEPPNALNRFYWSFFPFK